MSGRKIYIMSDSTVIKKLRKMGDTSNLHGVKSDRAEYCFPNGAKLLRKGSHIWVLYGYNEDLTDFNNAVKKFEAA